MPLPGDTHIHDHLLYLSQPGQIFKIHTFLNTSTPTCLSGISSRAFSDACPEKKQVQELLMKIVLDKNLQEQIWVALDEDSEIFMVAAKNLYYKIEIEVEQVPRDAQWEYGEDLQVILIDSLDEKYRERGGWVNRPPVRGARPLILIPYLGESFDDAIFLNYDPSAQDQN